MRHARCIGSMDIRWLNWTGIVISSRSYVGWFPCWRMSRTIFSKIGKINFLLYFQVTFTDLYEIQSSKSLGEQLDLNSWNKVTYFFILHRIILCIIPQKYQTKYQGEIIERRDEYFTWHFIYLTFKKMPDLCCPILESDSV